MAEGSEYFPIGSIAVCETLFKKKMEGEVLAFDPQTKVLVLKSVASNGKPNLNNVFMVNLEFVTNAYIKTEAVEIPAPPMPVLNFQRLTRRYELNIDEKVRMAKAMAAGVGPEGQLLFLAISKTYQDIGWQGENIVVLNQVTISPPYRPENCTSIKGSEDQAVVHIRKIVEKHIKDQQIQNQEENRLGSNSSQGGD